jgi:hypothetical protein
MTEAIETEASAAAAEPGDSGPEVSATRPMAAGRLAELSVHDLALIEKLRIVFEPGLNVLTGETGAGKSLLIDALGLAVGARADTSLVRHGSDSARVEALFDRLPEPLICVREVSAAGRSTARIDDESVTAARLAGSPAGWSRSTASTTSNGCSTSAGSASCSTPSAVSRRRGPRRQPPWKPGASTRRRWQS